MPWQLYNVTNVPQDAARLGSWVYEELRRLTYSLQSLPVPAEVTTSELTDATAPINVMGKYAGRPVYNTTTGLPLWASGAATTDTWDDAAGTTQHTPA